MPQVNAREHDLALAVVNEPPDLLDDLGRRSAAQSGADLRNDAIGAVQDATVLHFDECAAVAIKAADSSGPVADAEALHDVRQLAIVGHDGNHARQSAQG